MSDMDETKKEQPSIRNGKWMWTYSDEYGVKWQGPARKPIVWGEGEASGWQEGGTNG